MKHDSYLGNPHVKRDGIVQAFTPKELEEYIKCSMSCEYFVKNYIKIIHVDRGLVKFNPYDYQLELFQKFQDNRFNILLAARQSGKSITVCAYLLWYALFHSEKLIAVLANKGSTSREMLTRITLMLENIPFFLQPGCKSLNKGSIEFSNNSRIEAHSTSSSSIRGKAVSCVAGDTKCTYTTDNEDVFVWDFNFINTMMQSKLPQIKKWYVYKTTNKINGKTYIGAHGSFDIENDGYMGSGKLIKRAIEKYGQEHFIREILFEFDTLGEAEAKERELVNEEYVLRKDNYNLALGGNVRVLIGEHNGFYGKSHSLETKKLISQLHQNNKYFADDFIIRGERIKGTREAMIALGLDSKAKFVYHLANEENNDRYVDEEKQQRCVEALECREESRRKMKIVASKRFKGVPKSKEHAQKISKAHMGTVKPWVAFKINNNPEKIRKTAEKHRGMKRSDASKKKMSEAAKRRGAPNKGKVYCYDPDSEAKSVCLLHEIPLGWVRGIRK